MKNVTLVTLNIRNFKGIKELDVSFSKNTRIEGKNASGKTSVADAYTWLLFGKDTFDRSETTFGIKPLDESGSEILNTETSVAATLLVGDKEVQLKRVRKERWVKRTGDLEPTHEGHTTKYYVNEVPSKKKEYDAYVSGIVDEELFKLLTQPHYFAETVSWQDRRKTLLEMAGATSDLDIAKADKRFADLLEPLSEHPLDDYRKILNERRRKLKKDLEHIPTRVDEARRSIPEVDGVEQAKVEVARIDDEIKKVDARIASIQNGQATQELTNKIQSLDVAMDKLQNELEHNLIQKGIKLSTEQQTKVAERMKLEQAIRSAEGEVDKAKQLIEGAKAKQDELRNEWIAVNGEEFKHADECVCPTCEQELPADKVENARNKALEEFNLDKSKRLSAIVEEGKSLGASIEEGEREIAALQAKMKENDKKLAKVNEVIASLEEEITRSREAVKLARNDERIKALRVERSALEEELTKLKGSVSESIQTLKDERTELESKKKAHESVMSLVTLKERTEERIKELEDEQKELATQFEDVEKELHLIDTFVEHKVATLTEAINNKFKSVTWKLFDRQVNGALKETCEALYGGVPYNAGLNTGARIKAGLDIIDALSKHYETSVPAWVDNAEAVTDKLESTSQLVELHAVAGIDTITVQ